MTDFDRRLRRCAVILQRHDDRETAILPESLSPGAGDINLEAVGVVSLHRRRRMQTAAKHADEGR